MVRSVSLLTAAALLAACEAVSKAPSAAPAAVAAPAVVNAAVATPVAAGTCQRQIAPSGQTFTFTGPDGAATLQLQIASHSYPDQGLEQFRRVITRAGRLVYRMEGVSFETGELQASFDFGEGFRGIRHAEIHRRNGQSWVETDGRPLEPLADGADPASAVFEDHLAPPGVTVDPAVLKDIQGILTQAGDQIATCGAPAAAAAQPGHVVPVANAAARPAPRDVEAGACKVLCGGLFDSCNCCSGCCNVPLVACDVSAFAGLIACVVGTVGTGSFFCALGFVVAAGSCESEYANCLDGCAGSSACCGPACAEGHPSQDCAYRHCSPGATCCGGQSCCDHQSDCCGNECLEGVLQGWHCAGGTACPPGTGDSCGAACCPGDRPVCRESSPGAVCCAEGAGDVCHNGPFPACCPSDSPVCLGDVCCPAGDKNCGDDQCCPPPGICSANGRCCDAPSTVCGNGCCSPDEVCTPARNICCGGSGTLLTSTFCGNDCCGPDEVCMNGTFCCPGAQACGDTCCPAGTSCIDGTCSSCPAGTAACQYGAGNPVLCCPPNEGCCADQCCPAGLICCGTTCCALQ